jgi:hypothetical protein
LSKSSLLRMLRTWALTVATLMNKLAAISAFDKPPETAPYHLGLTVAECRQPGSGPLVLTGLDGHPIHQPSHDLR